MIITSAYRTTVDNLLAGPPISRGTSTPPLPNVIPQLSIASVEHYYSLLRMHEAKGLVDTVGFDQAVGWQRFGLPNVIILRRFY